MLFSVLLLLFINRFDYYRRLNIIIKMHIQQPWTDALQVTGQLSECASNRFWTGILSQRHVW